MMTALFDLPEFQKRLDLVGENPSTIDLPSVDLFRSTHREQERHHLQAIFMHLNDQTYKREVQKRLLLGDMSNYLGAWYELMVYDWLWQTGKDPQPVPKTQESQSRPDFHLPIGNTKTYIEVAHVQASLKDQDLQSQRAWLPARTATFQTMRERLIDKMGQHKMPEGEAYVICLCLASIYIGWQEVKTVLFGTEAVNIISEEVVSLNDGEIFESHGDELYIKYKKVSGILVAKNNRRTLEEGYRLDFGYIQNPYAETPLPSDAFGEIPRFIITETTRDRIFMQWK